MDVKIFLKIHLQQNFANIFHHVFQCQSSFRSIEKKSLFRRLENKQDEYRGKDEKFL